MSDSTPVGRPSSAASEYACRARVPPPVPISSRWVRFTSTSSSTTGYTASRPRSIRLWPPTLTTVTSGRIGRSGTVSVAAANSGSLSARSISSVSSDSLVAVMGPPPQFGPAPPTLTAASDAPIG